MTICLIDTDVFCNLIPVPGRDQDTDEVYLRNKELLRQGVSFLLPIAVIVETGNHVAQCRDGQRRRQVASRFVEAVAAAIDGEGPWTPSPAFDPDELRGWLTEFPDSAMRKIGLADLSIIKEFERQCVLHRGRRIFIWSLDSHLASYDRPGTLT